MKSKKDDTIQLVLSNIPNLLTVSRFLLTFVVVYLILTSANIILIVSVFVFAALTDFFDGKLARRFKWESEFGRKADIIADRFLWICTALAFIAAFGLKGLLNWKEGIPLLLMMTRELISAPFALAALISKKEIPQARYVAKVTTFLQGLALPSLILGVYYPFFLMLAWIFSIAAAITGFYSALYYIQDIKEDDRKQRRRRKR